MKDLNEGQTFFDTESMECVWYTVYINDKRSPRINGGNVPILNFTSRKECEKAIHFLNVEQQVWKKMGYQFDNENEEINEYYIKESEEMKEIWESSYDITSFVADSDYEKFCELVANQIGITIETYEDKRVSLLRIECECDEIICECTELVE